MIPMVVLGPKKEQQYWLFIESVQQVGSTSEGEPLILEITLTPGILAKEVVAITLTFSVVLSYRQQDKIIRLSKTADYLFSPLPLWCKGTR